MDVGMVGVGNEGDDFTRGWSLESEAQLGLAITPGLQPEHCWRQKLVTWESWCWAKFRADQGPPGPGATLARPGPVMSWNWVPPPEMQKPSRSDDQIVGN